LNGKGLAEAENFEAQEELKQELLKDRSSPPVLVDLSNTVMTQKTSGKSKEVAAATKAIGMPDGPTAVVGLNKLQKAVAQLFGRGSHYFDSLDQAKEWLVKEDKKRKKG
jgi:predicted HAD superfamily phosphohydrolase YqeG